MSIVSDEAVSAKHVTWINCSYLSYFFMCITYSGNLIAKHNSFQNYGGQLFCSKTETKPPG